MKALLTVMMAGVLLGGVFADRAEAGDRGHGKRGHGNARYYRDAGNYRGGTYFGGAYFRPHDVVVIRDYYRPYLPPGSLPVSLLSRRLSAVRMENPRCPGAGVLRTAVRSGALRVQSRLHRRPRGGLQQERLHSRHRRGVLTAWGGSCLIDPPTKAGLKTRLCDPRRRYRLSRRPSR